MRVRPLPPVALLVGLAGCASGGGGGAPHPTAPDALPAQLAAAQRANQPLVVEFGASWCKPCHEFATHVLTDPRVVAALQAVTFVQYDVESAAGADAAKRCDIAGVPAVVVLDRAGAVVKRRAASEPSVDEFLAFLHDAAP